MHAVLWLLLGRGLAIEVPGSGPRAGAVCSKVWASEVCSSVSSCRLPGKAAAVCPPDPGNASAGPRCQAGTRGANVWFWIPRDRRVTAGVKGLGEQDGRTLRWERGCPVTQFGGQSISKQRMGKEGGVCGRSLDKWNHHHRHFALTYIIDGIQNIDNIQIISNPTSLTSNSNTSPKPFPLSAPHHDEPPIPLPARGVRSRRRPTHRRPQRRRQEPAQHAHRRPQPGLLLVPLPPRQRHPRRLVSPPLSSPPTSFPTPLSHPPTPLH